MFPLPGQRVADFWRSTEFFSAGRINLCCRHIHVRKQRMLQLLERDLDQSYNVNIIRFLWRLQDFAHWHAFATADTNNACLYLDPQYTQELMLQLRQRLTTNLCNLVLEHNHAI